jgi:ATP-dependent RNA/DNA helicase IGHMBP2
MLDALSASVGYEIDEAKKRTTELRQNMTAKSLEENGLLLRKGLVGEERTALFGRIRVRFEEDPSRPGHVERFDVRPGSVVRLREKDENGQTLDGASGIVAHRSPRQITVVFDDASIRLTQQADLIRTEDESTLRRMSEAVEQAYGLEGRAASLLEILLGVKPPTATQPGTFRPLDDMLHADQLEACLHGVFAPEIALVHGPPGTGKTRALVEIVRQSLNKSEKILCLCASNAAIDHLAIALLDKDPKLHLARIGHPARIHKSLEEHTLAGLTENHERRQLAKSYLDDAFRILQTARKRSARGRDAWRQEREARVEAGRLFADARRLERQAVEEVLRKTQILCGTLLGFTRDLPDKLEFDLLVVDEASQVFTPALLPGLFRARRIVLAGDHKQLPPTLLAPENHPTRAPKTAFESLMVRSDATSFSHMLKVQHRMNEQIMAFSSKTFYDELLKAHESVQKHGLFELGVQESPILLPERALDVVDTAGAGHDESGHGTGQSINNDGESAIVHLFVKVLMESQLDPAQIGLITPYAAQVALLSERLKHWIEQGLEIDSVDGFQGREKEVILFSAVRSNPDGNVGFLSDARRLNVALTRARRKLIVVGDSATLSHDSLWNQFFEYAMEVSAYRSCFELPDLDLLGSDEPEPGHQNGS